MLGDGGDGICCWDMGEGKGRSRAFKDFSWRNGKGWSFQCMTQAPGESLTPVWAGTEASPPPAARL